MAIELERSYVFAVNEVSNIVQFLDIAVYKPITIRDEYLSHDLRIRFTSNKNILTRKTGDKSSGHRIENEHQLGHDIASTLARDTKLSIVKQRYQFYYASNDFKITLDIISEPMKIAILEIESTNDQMPPTANEVFGKNLIECPLSAWDLFKQKIGICGAPSCGKTEMAKTLSGLLNTRLHANSFHVLEYATTFIQKYNRHPNTMDQFMIWYSQKAREEDAMSKANIVISDCPTFLAYIYMLFHNRDNMSDQFRIHLVKLYKRVLEDLEGYSRIIYLRPNNIVSNNIRFQNGDEVRDLANRIHSFIKWHNIPHIVADRGDAYKILKSLFFINDISEERRSI